MVVLDRLRHVDDYETAVVVEDVVLAEVRMDQSGRDRDTRIERLGKYIKYRARPISDFEPIASTFTD